MSLGVFRTNIGCRTGDFIGVGFGASGDLRVLNVGSCVCVGMEEFADGFYLGLDILADSFSFSSWIPPFSVCRWHEVPF